MNGKQSNLGAAGTKDITNIRIDDAKIVKKSETREFSPIPGKKAKTISENFDLVSEEATIPIIKSASENQEIIYPEAGLEKAHGQGLINGPSNMKTVRGIVLSSEDTTPLPGVKVIVKGSNQETTSDIRGKFIIPALQDSATILVAQYVGMKMKETRLGSSSFVNIKMEPDTPFKEEAIIVGYGTQKKSGINRSETKKEQTQTSSSHPIPLSGIDGFNEYVMKNHVFPSTNLKISKTKVILNFLVRIDGKLDSIIVVKSQGEEFSVEAIRLLRDGPGWIPATRNGKKIDEAVQVKIVLSSKKQ